MNLSMLQRFLQSFLYHVNINTFLKGKENEKRNDFCAGNGIEPVTR